MPHTPGWSGSFPVPSDICLAAVQGGSPLRPPQPVTGLAICGVSIAVTSPAGLELEQRQASHCDNCPGDDCRVLLASTPKGALPSGWLWPFLSGKDTVISEDGTLGHATVGLGLSSGAGLRSTHKACIIPPSASSYQKQLREQLRGGPVPLLCPTKIWVELDYGQQGRSA